MHRGSFPYMQQCQHASYNMQRWFIRYDEVQEPFPAAIYAIQGDSLELFHWKYRGGSLQCQCTKYSPGRWSQSVLKTLAFIVMAVIYIVATVPMILRIIEFVLHSQQCSDRVDEVWTYYDLEVAIVKCLCSHCVCVVPLPHLHVCTAMCFLFTHWKDIRGGKWLRIVVW